MHPQDQLVYLPGLLGEASTVPNGDCPSDITGVVLPFSAGIDEEDLRLKAVGVVGSNRGAGGVGLMVVGRAASALEVPVERAVTVLARFGEMREDLVVAAVASAQTEAETGDSHIMKGASS